MPFTTEISNVKSEINSGLSAAQYTAKDLVYVSKAIEALANAEASGGTFVDGNFSGIIYVGSGAAGFSTAAALTNPVAVFQTTADDYAQIAFKNSSSNLMRPQTLLRTQIMELTQMVTLTWVSHLLTLLTQTLQSLARAMATSLWWEQLVELIKVTWYLPQATQVHRTRLSLLLVDLHLTILRCQLLQIKNVHIEIDTPSTSPTTGALTVVGGVGITGDINIAGSLTFGGASSSLETTTLAVADPLIFVGSNNRTDAVDLGLIAEYATTVSTITKAISNKALTSNVATLTTSTTHGFAVGDIVVVGSVDATFNGTYVVKAVPTTTTFTYDKTNANVTSAAVSPAGTAEVTTKRRFAGVIRDASDGVVKFFKDATTKPTSVVNLCRSRGLICLNRCWRCYNWFSNQY
jgi:hypothetical protein